MPPTTTDTDTRETAERARQGATRVQRKFDAAEQDIAPVLENMIGAWTELFRIVTPPVLLQPEAGVRALAAGIEQLFELQRRFAQEILTAGRDVVAGSDVERSNGYARRAA